MANEASINRMWVQSRGTLPFPVLKTSVIVTKETIIDDLKGMLKSELAPLLDQVPKPAITFYHYNKNSDDYLTQNITRKVLDNPLPELLSEAPGTNIDDPLFFDYDVKFVKAA
jgi:hypothetical protein|eukprot:CAMPEP_0174282672 /NCGR_PEP_ID=MMETSP0809-20121228/3220_1 /TAXON_ID=73025 ORGANISM="Eutreptiella gymnastica-like, Strain CCMP1594" /NCGR_SAMPLE_ID=MMETSP0809 /ASSEMBLY_ACC=CAM_ASM_000658 /LENGTH=112 /DNA_ID=CAMNT_0015377047 /DNA_START=27 /DNA_END=365 /DNA_ORIENTATION=-